MFRLSSASFLLVHFLLPSFAYVITTQPWQTDRPAPGLTLFYDIQVQANEVVLVDILLFNGDLGNTTTIFGNSDLTKQDDRNAGFDIPFVPPGTTYAIRLVETSTKRFLQDSPPFQIFAVGSTSGSTSLSASSIPPTTLPTPFGLSTTSSATLRTSSSSTSSSSTSLLPTMRTPSSSTSLLPTVAAGSGITSMAGASKSRKVGPIVGALIGCVVIIVIGLAIILWRRHRRSPKFNPSKEDKNALAKAAPEGRLGSVQPFVLHSSNGSPVEIPGPNGGDALPSPSSPGTGGTNKAGPLPKKFTDGHSAQMETVTLGDAGSSPSASNTMSTRAELLRQERERINREIASLENRSTPSESRYGGSSYGTDLSESSSHPMMASVPPVPIGSTIHDQIASLRAQIRQIEQAYGGSSALAGVGDEPPPVYDGPPSSTIIGGSRPLPNIVPLGDREGD